MRITNFFVPALLAGTLLTGCSNDAPAPKPTPTVSTIQVTVSEAGAPSYDLNEAHVVDANYRSGAPRLSLAGKLSNGKTLLLNFTKGTATTDYTTNALTSTLEGATGTNTVGTTTYDVQTKLVTGSFRTTYPGVGEVVGSFAGIQL
ncbi:hypothetical protein [Hymenobacter ruricola]|uniref:CHRD domain-containing protein n=1 Tax=Hymenobacter ruricola TaxID=2791023 RepID=A0ABS0I9V3_9BACT|nr:hypothetical protein [Hymenobacter ruricola]MBF9223687.1 hypothetical protein [Hymenobacter ruricola]